MKLWEGDEPFGATLKVCMNIKSN